MMTHHDETFISRAIELAREHSSDGRHGPFGAVIVKDNKILAEGWNGVVANVDPTAHAEVQAIRTAAKKLGSHDLSGCTLYASCEPCPMCLAAIYWARIDRVVFAATKEDAADVGFDDSKIYNEMAKLWSSRQVAFAQMRRGEAIKVMQSWLKNPQRINY